MWRIATWEAPYTTHWLSSCRHEACSRAASSSTALAASTSTATTTAATSTAPAAIRPCCCIPTTVVDAIFPSVYKQCKQKIDVLSDVKGKKWIMLRNWGKTRLLRKETAALCWTWEELSSPVSFCVGCTKNTLWSTSVTWYCTFICIITNNIRI